MDVKRICSTFERLESRRNIGGPPDFQRGDIQPERAGRGLSFTHFQHRGGIIGINQDRQPLETGDKLAQEFEALKGAANALYVQGDLLTIANRSAINTWTLGVRLPSMHAFREEVQAGALMSYGARTLDLFRRAAEIVDKILRGEKPANIPVEQPTKFDFVINLTTAKMLGLKVPDKLLVAADEVIE